MQSKKTIVQSSTFSLPYGVQLMISSKKKKKKFFRFNWESNKLGIFAYFQNIRGEISWF